MVFSFNWSDGLNECIFSIADLWNIVKKKVLG